MGEFQQGLFGCFSDCRTCICSYFLPCFVAGKNAAAVGDDCLLCGLVVFVPFANIYFMAETRRKIRESKGIEGGFVDDILKTWCCLCCSLAQEAHEVNSLGEGMAVDIERQ